MPTRYKTLLVYSNTSMKNAAVTARTKDILRSLCPFLHSWRKLLDGLYPGAALSLY